MTLSLKSCVPFPELIFLSSVPQRLSLFLVLCISFPCFTLGLNHMKLHPNQLIATFEHDEIDINELIL
jgi:hypothetical protein